MSICAPSYSRPSFFFSYINALRSAPCRIVIFVIVLEMEWKEKDYSSGFQSPSVFRLLTEGSV